MWEIFKPAKKRDRGKQRNKSNVVLCSFACFLFGFLLHYCSGLPYWVLLYIASRFVTSRIACSTLHMHWFNCNMPCRGLRLQALHRFTFAGLHSADHAGTQKQIGVCFLLRDFQGLLNEFVDFALSDYGAARALVCTTQRTCTVWAHWVFRFSGFETCAKPENLKTCALYVFRSHICT